MSTRSKSSLIIAGKSPENGPGAINNMNNTNNFPDLQAPKEYADSARESLEYLSNVKDRLSSRLLQLSDQPARSRSKQLVQSQPLSLSKRQTPPGSLVQQPQAQKIQNITDVINKYIDSQGLSFALILLNTEIIPFWGNIISELYKGSFKTIEKKKEYNDLLKDIGHVFLQIKHLFLKGNKTKTEECKVINLDSGVVENINDPNWERITFRKSKDANIKIVDATDENCLCIPILPRIQCFNSKDQSFITQSKGLYIRIVFNSKFPVGTINNYYEDAKETLKVTVSLNDIFRLQNSHGFDRRHWFTFNEPPSTTKTGGNLDNHLGEIICNHCVLWNGTAHIGIQDPRLSKGHFIEIVGNEKKLLELLYNLGNSTSNYWGLSIIKETAKLSYNVTKYSIACIANYVYRLQEKGPADFLIDELDLILDQIRIQKKQKTQRLLVQDVDSVIIADSVSMVDVIINVCAGTHINGTRRRIWYSCICLIGIAAFAAPFVYNSINYSFTEKYAESLDKDAIRKLHEAQPEKADVRIYQYNKQEAQPGKADVRILPYNKQEAQPGKADVRILPYNKQEAQPEKADVRIYKYNKYKREEEIVQFGGLVVLANQSFCLKITNVDNLQETPRQQRSLTYQPFSLELTNVNNLPEQRSQPPFEEIAYKPLTKLFATPRLEDNKIPIIEGNTSNLKFNVIPLEIDEIPIIDDNKSNILKKKDSNKSVILQTKKNPERNFWQNAQKPTLQTKNIINEILMTGEFYKTKWITDTTELSNETFGELITNILPNSVDKFVLFLYYNINFACHEYFKSDIARKKLEEFEKLIIKYTNEYILPSTRKNAEYLCLVTPDDKDNRRLCVKYENRNLGINLEYFVEKQKKEKEDEEQSFHDSIARHFLFLA
jgi:hypothetical protein